MLYRRVAIPQTIRRADLIITVSENSKKDIVKFFKVNPNKIKVIYNGVDRIFRPLDPDLIKTTLNKFSINSPYILSVGTIDHPGKNSISLIRAFKKVKLNYQEYKLVLVGKPGFGYEHIKNEILKLQLLDEVLIIGYVSDSDLVCLYNGAEVFAFLSLYEGFGLPLIEAMACGTPVVASNTSCLPEIVGEAGIIVHTYDISKIAEEIEKLIIETTFRNEMIKKGFEQSKRFSWEDSARKTLKIFEDMKK